MSDTQEDLDPDIRVLRDKAGQTDTLTTENVDLKRQLMFANAGIKIDSTLGKMLYQTFEGEDAVKLVEQATEIGLLGKAAPAKEEQHADAGQQGMREQFAGGQAPDADPGPDPWDVGYNNFWAQRKRGVPVEQAQLGLVDGVLTAAFKKDRRVLWDPRSHQAAAAIADEMAML